MRSWRRLWLGKPRFRVPYAKIRVWVGVGVGDVVIDDRMDQVVNLRMIRSVLIRSFGN